ncbi:hypothetical protein [Caenispirillum bisanense]|uniref:hypothetical protein n=1 Tax=Caenispirillum bisanense TaxID=414052 RepID=UPI0011429B8D|nr:hypothetical protein [Caenispirillum bisanense]
MVAVEHDGITVVPVEQLADVDVAPLGDDAGGKAEQDVAVALDGVPGQGVPAAGEAQRQDQFGGLAGLRRLQGRQGVERGEGRGVGHGGLPDRDRQRPDRGHDMRLRLWSGAPNVGGTIYRAAVRRSAASLQDGLGKALQLAEVCLENLKGMLQKRFRLWTV